MKFEATKMNAAGQPRTGMMERLGWGHRRARWVLAYAASGPFGILALLTPVLGRMDVPGLSLSLAFPSLLALVFLAIIRPRSYNRSPMRALSGMLWLMVPLIVVASDSVPVESLFMRGENNPPLVNGSAPTLWITLWLAIGFVGCGIAAIMSARSGNSREVVEESGSSLAGPRVPPFHGRGQHARFAGIVTAVVVMSSATALGWFALSLLSSIPRSHIRGNVPPPGQFDGLMRRDLVAYFGQAGSQRVAVDYELLRRGPTQTGIAYPKFYAWVRVKKDTGGPIEGAVLLAAEERVRFEVRDFLSSDDLLAKPQILRETFPLALHEELLRRARHTPR